MIVFARFLEVDAEVVAVVGAVVEVALMSLCLVVVVGAVCVIVVVLVDVEFSFPLLAGGLLAAKSE